MSKIVLFNGPKLVGKDEAINHLDDIIRVERAECKDHLYTLVQNIFNVDSDDFWRIYEDRNEKDKPNPLFRVTFPDRELNYFATTGLKLKTISEITEKLIYAKGRDHNVHLILGDSINLSIREAMIYVSEVLIKPRFGKDYFGEARVKFIESINYPSCGIQLFVDGSTAFVDELKPLIESLGQENILLIRVHRNGFTFEGDSRDYILDGVIDNTVDIYNNGTIEEYFNKVVIEVEKFLGVELKVL